MSKKKNQQEKSVQIEIEKRQSIRKVILIDKKFETLKEIHKMLEGAK